MITSAGEDVEKMDTLYTVTEKVNWCSHCGKQYGSSSKKLKIKLPRDLRVSLLCMYSKKIKSALERDICIPMFIVFYLQ